MAWDVVTLPKTVGGLGIKEALAWNKALFFKLVGDIRLARPCLWTRWVAVYYGRRGSFWSTQAREDDSCVWKGILRVRDEFMCRIDPLIWIGSAYDLNPILGPSGRVMSSLVYDVFRRRAPLVEWGSII